MDRVGLFFIYLKEDDQMPKATKRGENNRRVIPRIKSKIGGRKSLRSAKTMSATELLEIVNGSGCGRDKHKARVELSRRDI